MYHNLLAIFNRGMYKQYLREESELHEDTTTLSTFKTKMS